MIKYIWLSGLCITSSFSVDFKNYYKKLIYIFFKADENEIILAVDNGNVEVYDRGTRKLTCVLVGQYSASPVKLDFNSRLIFVQYTCAFAASRRRQTPSSWWNIYCRKSKRNDKFGKHRY